MNITSSVRRDRGIEVKETNSPRDFTPYRWEYRSKLMERDAELDQYGSDGWECYSVVAAPCDQAMFYFRRRVR